MEQDFRKKNFRGAKIEDIILEVENLCRLCEEKARDCNDSETKRFYEGMAIAYITILVKLKGNFDYVEPAVIEELYHALERTSNATNIGCSFCSRSQEEVGQLAFGPGVAICNECLEFGKKIIEYK